MLAFLQIFLDFRREGKEKTGIERPQGLREVFAEVLKSLGWRVLSLPCTDSRYGFDEAFAHILAEGVRLQREHQSKRSSEHKS